MKEQNSKVVLWSGAKVIVFLLLLIPFSAKSQAYYIIKQSLPLKDFDMPLSSNYLWQPALPVYPNIMPFDWKFYGVSVRDFKAYPSGYISFNTSVNNEDSNFKHLPNVAAPLKSIFVNWNHCHRYCPDCWGNGSNACIRAWIEGEAPNRHYTIEWRMADTTGQPIGFGIRFYEKGNFDIYEKYKGASMPHAGCQDSTGKYAAEVKDAITDNTLLSFNYGAQPLKTIKLLSNDIPETIQGRHWYGANFTVQNCGAAPIHTLSIFFDAEGRKTETRFNVLINPGELYNANIPLLWNPATEGLQKTRLWVVADDVSSTDTLIQEKLITRGINAKKYLLLESEEATWCPYTPSAYDIIRKMKDSLHNIIDLVGHSFDDLKISLKPLNEQYDGLFPNCMFDRRELNGWQNRAPLYFGWDTALRIASTFTAPVFVKVDTSFNYTTRVLSVKITAEFTDYAVGNMSFNAVLSHSFTSGYTQKGVDRTYNNYPQMNAITVYSSKNTWGDTGLIPHLAKPGERYFYECKFSIPYGNKPCDYAVTGMVMRYDAYNMHHTYVMNSGQSGNEDTTRIKVIPNTPALQTRVWPNPSNGTFTLDIHASEASSVWVNICDITGNVVYKKEITMPFEGNYQLPVSLPQIYKGIYYVYIQNFDHQYTNALIIQNQ